MVNAPALPREGMVLNIRLMLCCTGGVLKGWRGCAIHAGHLAFLRVERLTVRGIAQREGEEPTRYRERCSIVAHAPVTVCSRQIRHLGND